MVPTPLEQSTASVWFWYMVGVALRVLWRWADWVSKQPADRVGWGNRWRPFWSHHTAEIIKTVIVSVVVAFVWTQGLLWLIAQQMGYDLPPFAVTAASSIGVGFALAWLMTKWFVKKT